MIACGLRRGGGRGGVGALFSAGPGPDRGPAPAMLRQLEERLAKLGRGRIVDGVGRGIALDRDGNYAKIQKAYECMVLGAGAQYRL